MFHIVTRIICLFTDRFLFVFLVALGVLSGSSWFFLFCYPRFYEQIALANDSSQLDKKSALLTQRLAAADLHDYEVRIKECDDITKNFTVSTGELVQRCVAALEKNSLHIITWTPRSEKARYNLVHTQVHIELQGRYHQFVSFLKQLSPQIMCKTCTITKSFPGIHILCDLTIVTRAHS